MISCSVTRALSAGGHISRVCSVIDLTALLQIRTMARAVTLENLNPNMVKLQYAVRGPLVARAIAIMEELQKGASKPFKRVIRANIGDAHAMGQKPITYFRQVLACVSYPPLIECGNFPEDVQRKARCILQACSGGSVGAYTNSNGIDLFRQHVAKYIENRDGYPSNWNDVVLSAGASGIIKSVLQCFINKVDNKPTGVMVPTPQYPLYSASLAEYGLVKVDYYLDEENNWGLSISELERALCEASSSTSVRALVVINPGNPTGQVLTKQNIIDIIKFVHKKSLCVFADEVYQHNVYAKGSKFHSFKKVLRELGSPYSDEVELVSFMTASKGYIGECGLRGGWAELVNFDKDVQAHLYKCLSAMLCPTVLGQTIIDLVADHPKPGDPSHDKWLEEKTAILTSLNNRAKMCHREFNQMPGFSCNEVQGAMYAFPRITIPPKALAEAKKKNLIPDVFYAFQLLENTGICIIPGSGFGQKPGTYHFRTTILPQPDLLREMLQIFKKFHLEFTEKYS